VGRFAREPGAGAEPGNLALLRLIAERKPSSLTELAAMTGGAVSNLSRTLATMEGYGLVKMVDGEGHLNSRGHPK